MRAFPSVFQRTSGRLFWHFIQKLFLWSWCPNTEILGEQTWGAVGCEGLGVVMPCAVRNPVTRLEDPLLSAFPGGLGTWGHSREPDQTLECKFMEASLSSFQALWWWVRAALLDSGSPLPAQLVPSQVWRPSGNQGRRSSGQAEQPSGYLLRRALWERLLPGAAAALSKALVTDTFFIGDLFLSILTLGNFQALPRNKCCGMSYEKPDSLKAYKH